MNSSLKDRLGPRVQFRAIDRAFTGSPATFSFKQTVANPNTLKAVLVLARRRMPMADAHRLMTGLVECEPGATLVAEVPRVENVEALRSELEACGIAAAASRSVG